MSNAWALNDNHDMFVDLASNEVARVAGLEQVRQSIKTRLQFFLAEWFLNETVGVPWFQQIYKEPLNIPLSEATIKKEILETPGVLELLNLRLAFDTTNRLSKIEGYTARAESGLINETL